MSRFVSLAVAASLLAPPFIEIGHASRTAHVRCPVDGRIEDARDDAPTLPHSHSAGVVLPSNEAGAHSHNACDATPAARLRSGAATPPCDNALRLAFARAVIPADDAPRTAAVALYHLAPKLSPPLS